MKIFNIKSVLAISMLLMMVVGCKDDTQLGIAPQHSNPPAAPIVDTVINTNGGAVIHFTAPAVDDLLAIEARYEINGKPYQTKSTIYGDSLVVGGFLSGNDYNIKLYSVDKSKNESKPVDVTISPLESPVEMTFKSLNLLASFGGVKVFWENETQAPLIVSVEYKDEFDEWVSLENFYSSTKLGVGTVRGLDTINTEFAVRVRDRWDNYSDSLSGFRKPIFEQEIPKSGFRQTTPSRLPGDAGAHFPVSNIWDGNTVNSPYHSAWPPTEEGQGLGNYITFDLGAVVKLSRFKQWHRSELESWFYSHNNLKFYDIYGAAELTSEMITTGDISYWTLLTEVENYKPSGEGPLTNDDIAYMRNGDEHEFPIEAPPVRYIRIHMKETWSGSVSTQIGEMSFWGAFIK